LSILDAQAGIDSMGCMRCWILGAVLLSALPSAARSQTIEITPIVGYRFGGSLSVTGTTRGGGMSTGLEVDDAAAWGVHLGYKVDEGEVELLYSRQATKLQTEGLFTGVPVLDLDLEIWQFGGNYFFGKDDAQIVPFIGIGLGLTRLLPKSAGLSDETRFSASFVGGVKVWLGRHFGIRLEGRGFFTVLDSDSERVCGSNSGCLFRANTTDLSQAEARAGLILRF
jgi:hypothetical protein